MTTKILKLIFNVLSSFYLMKVVDEITLTTNLQRCLVFTYFFALIYILEYISNKYLVKKCTRKELIQIMLVSLMCTAIFTLCKGKKLIPSNYVDTNVSISTTKNKNIKSEGNEVWILGININGKPIDLGTIQDITGFSRGDAGELVADTNKNDATLNLFVRGEDNVEIIFGKHAWSGIIQIKHLDNVETIDLYDEAGSQYKYYVQPNEKETSTFYKISMIIISVFVIYYAFSLICIFLYIKLFPIKNEKQLSEKKTTIRKNNCVIRESTKQFLNRNKGIILVFSGILVVRSIYLLSYKLVHLCPDSIGYMEYDFNKLISLDFSDGRTPIYPLVLKLSRLIFGEGNYLRCVSLFQSIISFIATIYFYKALKLITNKKLLILGITFFFGASNTFVGYDTVILTESLALSGTVFLIYYLLSYLKYNQIKSGIKAICLTLILTFLRPSFLLFDAIILVFLILQFIITRKKEIKKLILISLGSFAIILSYSFLFYNSMGIFTISDPMPRQLLIVCIDRGYYLDSEDKEYVEFIKEGVREHNNDSWGAISGAIPKFGLKRTQNYAKECIKNNLPQYVKDQLQISLENANYDFYAYNIVKENLNPYMEAARNLCLSLFDILKPIHALLLAVYFLYITLEGLIVDKKIYWLPIGFFAFITLIFVSSMIATCGEYIRTMIHMFPFIYVGLAYLVEFNLTKKREFSDSLPIRNNKN